MNSKNENGGTHHHHHHHHHGNHSGGSGGGGGSHIHGNGNGTSINGQMHYGQQLSNGINQNGLNAKLFSSLQQSHLQSSSPGNGNLNLQQQIMMQSPSVNMTAIAAYGQQPALLGNTQYNNNSNIGNNNANYNDDYIYNQNSNQKQISSIQWYEVEIKGLVKNISPKLWQWTHLRYLYLNDNNLMRLPPVISSLNHLQCLDASGNKIRTLPSEIGDMTSLRELYLNNNQIRVLPFEFGKLFKLQQLGMK